MTDVVPPLRDAGSHLSAALKLTRVRRGLTVPQIAEAMHVAPRTINASRRDAPGSTSTTSSVSPRRRTATSAPS